MPGDSKVHPELFVTLTNPVARPGDYWTESFRFFPHLPMWEA